jgi:hypothetical protein
MQTTTSRDLGLLVLLVGMLAILFAVSVLLGAPVVR